jgi:hypothetical protein
MNRRISLADLFPSEFQDRAAEVPVAAPFFRGRPVVEAPEVLNFRITEPRRTEPDRTEPDPDPDPDPDPAP